MGGVGTLRTLVSLFVLALLLATSVLAIGLGVNKGRIHYEDVLQNGYAQEEVIVTTDSEEPITGTYQFEGSIAPWLRVEPEAEFFSFSRSEPYKLVVIVEPPADAQLQEYSGGVRILTGEIGRTGGGLIGTTTRAAFLIRIGLGLSGTQHIECRAGGIQIQDTEIEQPFDFMATVVNRGNVRIQPDFVIQVFDRFQEELMMNVTVPMDREILPTVTQEFLTQIQQELPPAQYWARVNVPLCDDASLVTFDVLDRGGIADKGELVRIDASNWASTGDILPIYAIFKNTGSRTVIAKFKGTITTSDGKLVKVIETDQYNVPPGQTAEIETFFNPTEAGRYIVSGRVLYNNKLTFQKSTIINVQGPMLVAARQFGGPILLILLIIIVILLILIMIAKKRRRRRW